MLTMSKYLNTTFNQKLMHNTFTDIHSTQQQFTADIWQQQIQIVDILSQSHCGVLYIHKTLSDLQWGEITDSFISIGYICRHLQIGFSTSASPNADIMTSLWLHCRNTAACLDAMQLQCTRAQPISIYSLADDNIFNIGSIRVQPAVSQVNRL